MKTKTTMRLEAYIYGTLALTLLSGCTKIEQREAEPVPVSWQVIQDSPSTKAEAYDTNDKFLSWAWYLPNGKTWATNRAVSQLYINAAKISFVSGENCWRDASAHYYWPKAGALSFFAVSPSSLGSAVTCTAADGIKISNWDVNAKQDTDIMVADLATDKSANETSIGAWQTGVPTVFRHKLTKVEGFAFNLHKDYSNGHDGTTGKEYASGDIRYFVKSVKIKNVPQTGNFFNTTPGAGNLGLWEKQGTGTGSYTWYTYSGTEAGLEIKKQSADTPAPATGLSGRNYIYLMPQEFANPGGSPDWSTTPCIEVEYVKWTYTSATTYTSETIPARGSLYDVLGSSNHKLVINRRLNFKITFNNDSNTIIWAPDQSDWGSGDFEIYV